MKHYPLIFVFKYTLGELTKKTVFKIKDEYKLEIQTPETIKLFGSAKKINRQNKERRKCAKSSSGWSSISPMQLSR